MTFFYSFLLKFLNLNNIVVNRVIIGAIIFWQKLPKMAIVCLSLFAGFCCVCCHFPAFMAQLWLNDRLVCICLCMRACGHHERANWEQSPIQLLRFRHRQAPQGSFNNYVVMILAFLCQPTYCYVDSFTLHVDKNGHFWTTYPPHLVHVVIERPLTAVT